MRERGRPRSAGDLHFAMDLIRCAMKVEEARRVLSLANNEDDFIDLPPSVLSQLTVDDMQDGGSFKIGSPKDGALHLDWNGSLHRQGGLVFGEADHTWTRKYWYSGLEQYLDLVRRAVETRHRVKGDVDLIDYDDDGAYIALRFKINTTEANLARAYDAVRKIEAEVLEAAEQVADEVGQRIAEIAARLSG
jgi:hypothetical protein